MGWIQETVEAVLQMKQELTQGVWGCGFYGFCSPTCPMPHYSVPEDLLTLRGMFLGVQWYIVFVLCTHSLSAFIVH